MRKAKAARRLKKFAAFLAIILILGAVCETAYRTFLRWRRSRESASSAVFDLYAVGESTMRGEPDEEHLSPPRVASALLGGSIQGRPILIHQLAAGGASIYPQWHALRNALALRDRGIPGAVLIYSGHNEQPLEPEPRLLFHFYEGLKEKLLERSMLAGDLLLYAERAAGFRGYRSLRTYEFYLRRTIETAQEAGLTPILSPAIGNIRDWEPGLFCGGADCLHGALASLGPGLELESQGRCVEAIDRYAVGLRENPEWRAIFLYRIARCEEALGRYEAAREHYWDAVDADGRTNQRRANREQIVLVRRLAAQYRVPLVDAPELFKEASAHGAPGADLFADGHHPNINGYLILGNAYAQALSRVTGEPLKARAQGADGLGRLMHLDDGRKARILMDRGWTALSYCFSHALPEARLRLAEVDFKGALALDHKDLSSSLGLGLIEAARREPRLLQDPAQIAWLSERGLPLNPGEGLRLPRDLSDVVQRFKSLGVPESILDHLVTERR